MSPEARRKLIKAGIPPLRASAATRVAVANCRHDRSTIEPKPEIHVDQEYIDREIQLVLERLPLNKTAYNIPVVAAAMGKSPTWVRERFWNRPGVRDVGNKSRRFIEIPRDMVIAEVRGFYRPTR